MHGDVFELWSSFYCLLSNPAHPDTHTHTHTCTATHPHTRTFTHPQVHGDVFEPWCSFILDIDTDKPPEAVELGGELKNGKPTLALKGLRYRLRALDIDSTRPLPTNGKVCVWVWVGV